MPLKRWLVQRALGALEWAGESLPDPWHYELLGSTTQRWLIALVVTPWGVLDLTWVGTRDEDEVGPCMAHVMAQGRLLRSGVEAIVRTRDGAHDGVPQGMPEVTVVPIPRGVAEALGLCPQSDPLAAAFKGRGGGGQVH